MSWSVRFKYISLFSCLRLPCGESVKDVNSYLFSVVCDDGDIVEIYDENRPISAVQMFLPVLALREAKDNEENRLLNNKISESS